MSPDEENVGERTEGNNIASTELVSDSELLLSAKGLV